MKRKKLFIAVCTIIATIFFSSCAQPERPLSATELLNLGERYLLELNYEQALVQFTMLIEVEPMNPRGYIGAAEAHIGLGDTDSAVAVLRQGLERLPGNSEIQTKLDYLLSLEYEPAPNDEHVPTQIEEPPEETEAGRFALQIIEIYEVSGYEAVLTAMRTAEFIDAIIGEISDSDNDRIIFNRAPDTGIGFYLIDGLIFVYIGEFIGLERSGTGIWLNANATDDGYYIFTGNWSNDMPNGEGISTRVQDENTLEIPEGSTVAVVSVTSGTFQNGLVHGAINMQWTMNLPECTHNWNLTADNGFYHVIGSSEWSNTVVSVCEGCGADLSWESIDGVRGFFETATTAEYIPESDAIPITETFPASDDAPSTNDIPEYRTEGFTHEIWGYVWYGERLGERRPLLSVSNVVETVDFDSEEMGSTRFIGWTTGTVLYANAPVTITFLEDNWYGLDAPLRLWDMTWPDGLDIWHYLSDIGDHGTTMDFIPLETENYIDEFGDSFSIATEGTSIVLNEGVYSISNFYFGSGSTFYIFVGNHDAHSR